jgi:Spore coat polysaccharide biosynthesis protein F, CMP-KDO synthetase homolog
MSVARIVCIVEARYRSSRLPGKVLMPILGEPMLGRMLERLKRARCLDAIMVACPDGAEDDAVEKAAVDNGALCFRGSEEDVLARVVGAARAAEADVIVEGHRRLSASRTRAHRQGRSRLHARRSGFRLQHSSLLHSPRH